MTPSAAVTEHKSICQQVASKATLARLHAAVAGSLGLTDNFPLANAHLVDRLQQQGALVLAKTAMGEFAFFPSFCISRQAGPAVCWYRPKGTIMLA